MVSAGSITVAVRVRPPTAWEAARLPEPLYDVGFRGDGALSTPSQALISSGCLREIVKIVDDRILMFDPDQKDRAKAFVERGFVPPGTKRYKDKRFMFDRVFDAEASQTDLYQATAKPLLDGLLEGYNATVFAYGATGCGKTHTISGTDVDPGLIYLTMADLFQKIEDKRCDHNIDIYVTFLEIYNEEIRDLLAEPGTAAPRGGLQIREDKTVKVVGLVELHPTSAEQIKEIVLLGNTRRTQSPTHANETSSRSHAVLQIHITQSPRTASTSEERSMATLSIIDLAGSERAAATTNMGQRMVEGANINKSLLALGNCINALCESGGATRHVPYRNSKLTRLLKFSLGGNCKTVMIVCIAPASNHFDDTHNTLLYADRASKIKTKVVTRNVVNVDRHVGQYVEAINRLNLEVAELKARLAGKLNTEADINRRKKEEAKAEIERAKDDIRRKAEQTKMAILAGATIEGRLTAARIRLRTFNIRLAQLKIELAGSTMSPDTAAEHDQLSALAAQEEAFINENLEVKGQRLRSGNADSMFDAMLHAVAGRRSDKFDEFAIDNVKLATQYHKTEMERMKAEAQRDSLQEVLAVQTEQFARLIGTLSKCTVLVEDGSKTLISQTNPESISDTTRTISESLHCLAESNNLVFNSFTGQSANPCASLDKSALLDFKGYGKLGAPTISIKSPSRATHGKPTRQSRRSSSFGGVTSPGRNSHRKSPRKSLRPSMVPEPSFTSGRRAVSDKFPEKKKGVQWRDEAGQGKLDDGGLSPMTIDELSSKRPTSRCGSESEWEDEKTEDSVSYTCGSFSLSSHSQSTVPPKQGARRPPRLSRLDPSFLKTRGTSKLGSLAEDDESKELETTRRPPAVPFSDRANQLPTPPDSDVPDSNGGLRVSKIRTGREDSPEKKEAGTGTTSFRLSTSVAAKSTTSGNGRRRSNIGPLRSERARRRSSLLPQPIGGSDRENMHVSKSGGGARRVPIVIHAHTPAKRPKRASLLGARVSTTTTFLRPPSAMGNSSDPNASSGDLSMVSKGSKPTWR